MNWSLIPEIFFDLIARVVPGSILLLLAAAVQLGPRKSLELAVSEVPASNLASVLLFGIGAYFIAIILNQVWDSISRAIRRNRSEDLPDLNEFRIRKLLPYEGSRLGKLQAEKKLCEVLIPGMSILTVTNAWIIATRAGAVTAERFSFLAAMLIVIAALWGWRNSLERERARSYNALQQFFETGAFPADGE